MSVKGSFFARELNGENRDFCRITIANMRDVWEGPVRPEDIARFSEEWAAYKKKAKKKKPKGKALTSLPGMTEPRRCELELNNIETIEALAAAEETTLRNIGEPYVELAKIAKLQVTADKQKADLVEEVIVTTETLKAVKEKSNEPVDDSADGS
tara:strand:- start:692 stop:1153 length:462 start_codon:yes stop_codon:yes gene_type:complete